ncbi:M23 family metallopeptidase [Subsaxibacter sp. CAU 1640]|uniref:M23 family metallopeptidase n=1 Tax=Subsaxibacter sp. CAU 1640 TaxID=2933271 RepID=UPI00200418E9|nr:M23 family metallopeptidase [Subsaxibacter sp. CAU 1640]MCK7590441.1 M23 family metallopeptidase [Subsaxibacter sp. CAU 1640]
MKYLFIALIFSQITFSQVEYPKDYFRSPLDVTLILSGSFAELRTNHFHSGLDIKTQQRTGLNVYAAAEGYVSRIKIQHYGYGKALYVTHPNGYTTVYGHLQAFAPKIEAYLKAKQYEKESYEIELFPTAEELQIMTDEVIAYSGNTGGSGGPHLHFEIRDQQERTINPLLFGLDVKDSKPPTLTSVFAYPKDDKSTINNSNSRLELRFMPGKNNEYKVESIQASGEIGFSIGSHDQLDLAVNKNGLSNIQTFFNGNKKFEMDFFRFSFDESRHINRFIDYEYYKTKRTHLQKLFVEKGNVLSMFKDLDDDGYITVEEGTSSVYKVRLQDFAGNESWITIPITGKKPDSIPSKPENKKNYYVFSDQATTLNDKNVTVSFPANSFYEDTFIDFKVNNDTLYLDKDVIPLQKNVTIQYDISHFKDSEKDRLYIAELLGYKKYPSYLNTRRKENFLTASSNALGSYVLVLDTTKPTIAPVNFQDGKWLSKYRYLTLKITDDLSGIGNYRATINGKWILMEYEYKDNTLTFDFNDNIVTDTKNELKVIVTDNVGNSATFEATFFRK